MRIGMRELILLIFITYVLAINCLNENDVIIQEERAGKFVFS